MFCSKCGADLPDDSQFCRKCGKSLSMAVTSSGAAAAPAPAPVAKKKSSRAGLWVLLVIAAVVIWWAATSHSPGARQMQNIIKQQHTMRVGNGEDLTVKATGYSWYKLQVPQGATSVILQGNFTASGGSGDDIESYVLSQDDFVNWQHGHAAKTFFNSGKVTTKTFTVNLPSDEGTYYFVFDNRFSLLSQKNIELNATLTYYQ